MRVRLKFAPVVSQSSGYAVTRQLGLVLVNTRRLLVTNLDSALRQWRTVSCSLRTNPGWASAELPNLVVLMGAYLAGLQQQASLGPHHTFGRLCTRRLLDGNEGAVLWKIAARGSNSTI
jgi:hypothetical protein